MPEQKTCSRRADGMFPEPDRIGARPRSERHCSSWPSTGTVLYLFVLSALPLNRAPDGAVVSVLLIKVRF